MASGRRGGGRGEANRWAHGDVGERFARGSDLGRDTG
jgi:hypothetical protein